MVFCATVEIEAIAGSKALANAKATRLYLARQVAGWFAASTKAAVVKRFKILGTGTALPERVLTNHDLEAMVETSDQWIRERTGIERRRIAGPDVSSAQLGARALAAACADANLEPTSLDAIIVATSTADTPFPSTGCWIQYELGLDNGRPAFDVAAGCSGYIYALEVASSMLTARDYRRVAVVGCEVMSKVVDWTDRTTCVLFGDGAGCLILESCEEERGLLSSNLGANGKLAPILYQPAGGTRTPASEETLAKGLHYVQMQGGAVFRHAVRAMTAAAEQALADAGLGSDDIDLMVPHQANMRIMEACRERLRVPRDKMYSIIHNYGNMSAATIPVALHEARGAGRMPEGSIIALAAFGTGLTWGGGVLRV